ncbi:MAG: molecular chaperone HtpG [Pseudomonadota bacterium]
MSTETLGFQTEVKQLLHLMIHSLYSHREVFLRELISNASDALDKLRFLALDDSALYEGDSELRVRLRYDDDAHTITLEDNGIGMTREEVIENLGTIARSGTKEFLSRITGDKSRDTQLIGQFGVGFYSAFIVSEEVTVETRKAGTEATTATRWTSKGEGEYTLEDIEKSDRGTRITIKLKEDAYDFAQRWSLERLIKQYSDHIQWPIQLVKQQWDDEKKQNIDLDEWETINQATALWLLPKSEITEDQYNEFYKQISHDFESPLTYAHARVEGSKEYVQLLYIPSRAPFDLWDRNQQRGLKLYVRRVFIMDNADQLLPSYLRFVKGIVDSNDLPLNVSREILQESRDVDAIRKGCTNKILALLENMAQNEQEKYATFWENFGSCFKEGLGEDNANKERLAKLLRFSSTYTDNPTANISLADYVARMKEGQDAIYYITADNFNAAKNSPHLQIFRKKGIEVLLLADRVDEWAVAHLTEFEGKKLASVAKGDLKLDSFMDEEEKKAQAEISDSFKPLIEQANNVLKGRVKEVRLSSRLTDAPACLIGDEHELSSHLQRMLKAAGQTVPDSHPILELNPKHPFVQRLQAGQADAEVWLPLLFDQALLAEGGQLDDPAGFVNAMNRLLISQQASA